MSTSIAISNARWVGTIQAARVGVQLAGMVVLSHLLSPTDFGLVAMAFAVNNFALLIRDLGAGAAIIQRATLDERTTLTAHWASSMLGLALGLGLFAASGLLARLFQAEALQPLLQMLALSFPVLGSTTVHQALLERASRFALLARIEISAVASGLIVAIVAALYGAGAYSLILQTLTNVVVSAVQLRLASDLKLRWLWSGEQFRALWRFGGYLFGFNAINYLARNADAMIIGRALGAASLGPYSLAYRIMLFPLQNLTFVATRALMPVMSQSQHAPAQLGAMYLRVLSVIAFFTAPLMTGLFVLRDLLVEVVLGESWGRVAQLITWFAPIGFAQSLVSAGGAVLTSLGRTDVLFRLGVFSTALHVAAFFAGLRFGVSGVAAAYLGTTLLNGVLCFGVILPMVQQSIAALARAVAPSVAKALLMGVALEVLAPWTVALPGVARLIVLSLCGALIYLLATRAHLQPGDRDALRLLLKKA
ncbi:MAG TPA: lipopolysaccharide biosynthesis protein [Steroidobacteraceae bacterium]